MYSAKDNQSLIEIPQGKTLAVIRITNELASASGLYKYPAVE
jgi:hypothetical protein